MIIAHANVFASAMTDWYEFLYRKYKQNGIVFPERVKVKTQQQKTVELDGQFAPGETEVTFGESGSSFLWKKDFTVKKRALLFSSHLL